MEGSVSLPGQSGFQCLKGAWGLGGLGTQGAFILSVESRGRKPPSWLWDDSRLI